jgi:serine/threonine-protein kinase
MELLRGKHLSDYTAADRLLPVSTTLDLLARAATALDYAHRNNIVHRDIKPSNIMYDSDTDSLKLTDFGIARMMDVSRTRTGIVLGTPSFMSPEQLEGKNVSGHSDIFALGVSLYQLLTGHLPFRGTSMTELMFVIANEPHKPITGVRQDLPNRVDAILDKALAKNPANRFATGAEMAHALREVATQAA